MSGGRGGWGRQRGPVAPRAALGGLALAAADFTAAQSALSSPHLYLAYLLVAGLGVPLSEDALCAWVGARLAQGATASPAHAMVVLGCVYAGVTLSDALTFALGRLLARGFLPGMRQMLLEGKQADRAERAMAAMERYGAFVGFAQRLMVGFRFPLSLAAGFTGARFPTFFAGVCLGGLISLPAQLALGYLLRNNPYPFVAALGIVATPAFVGTFLGPLLAVFGFWRASSGPPQPAKER